MNDGERIVFFGTGAYFSIVALEHLIDSGFTPIAIVIPEYPAVNKPSLPDISFHSTTRQNPLIKIGENTGVPVLFAPEKNIQKLTEELSVLSPEFILVACWSYLLPETICSTASKAAMNLHPSLLPKYRGANPVRDQLDAGEKKFGVSLHLLSHAFDAGDIIKQDALDLPDKNITVGQIEKQAARVGIDSFVEAIKEFGGDKWQPKKQLTD